MSVLGWFGPRGVAWIVFVLLLVQATQLPEPAAAVVTWTVAVSMHTPPADQLAGCPLGWSGQAEWCLTWWVIVPSVSEFGDLTHNG